MKITKYIKSDVDKKIKKLFSSNERKGDLSSTLIELAPGKSTNLESHPEVEYWGIMRGIAEVTVEGRSHVLGSGDFIEILPGEQHIISNPSKTENLVFISIYEVNQHILNDKIHDSIKNKVNIIISSYPTPNGDLHLGHMGGPFISSDILHKNNLARGETSFFLSGTLGHQNHVDLLANKINSNYYNVAEQMSERIKSSFKRFKIKPSVFVEARPSLKFEELSHEIFSNLIISKNIFKKSSPVMFNKKTGLIVSEAELSGVCPHCSSIASGNDCEGCGNYHEEYQLINPMLSNELSIPTVLGKKSVERYFFSLETMRSELVSYLGKINLSSYAKKFVDLILQKPLPDIPLTHFKETGTNILNSDSGEKYHTTFEHLTKIIYSIDKLPCSLDNSEFNLSMFFGVDNIFYKVILLPALMIAAGYQVYLPNSFYINHFFLLDGEKFSTSRNHAIWAKDVDIESVGRVRAFLSYISPESKQSNFTREEYDCFCGFFFDNGILKLVQDFKTLLEGYNIETIPEPGDWNTSLETFNKKLNASKFALSKYTSGLQCRFSSKGIIRELLFILDLTRKFHDNLLENKKEISFRELRTSVALVFSAINIFSLYLEPVIGESCNFLSFIKTHKLTYDEVYDKNVVFFPSMLKN